MEKTSTAFDLKDLRVHLETQFELAGDKDLILDTSFKEFAHQFLSQTQSLPRDIRISVAERKEEKNASLTEFIAQTPTFDKNLRNNRALDFNSCTTLEKLHLALHEMSLFKPENNHLPLINGRGNHPNPPLMIVGYAPDEEDLRLKNLFTGERGQLLGGMLEKVLKIQKQMCYTSSFYRTLPYRSLANEERKLLDRALLKETELVDPKAILFMGRELATQVFNDPRPVEELREEVFSYGGRPAFITFSLRELLENPSLRHQTVPLLNLLRKKIL